MTTVTVDKNPFQEGGEAFAEGKAREACPYPTGSDKRREWLAGWDEAERYTSEARGP